MDLTSSSVIELKAELLKKQEQFAREKITGQKEPLRKKPSSLFTQNRGVAERNQRDLEELDKVARKLETSQVALERKAQLYDKFKNGDYTLADLENENILVDFERKEWEGADQKVPLALAQREIMETVDIGKDEWVSYVDEFGRNRVGLKSQIEDQMLVKFTKATGKATRDDDTDSGPTLVSEDMEREFKRRKWEQEADEAFEEPLVRHYSTRDEIRQKGVGFFAFSANEEERQEQMRQLQQLRVETLDKRKKKQELKDLRKERYQERLRALQEKRAKKTLGTSATESSTSAPEDQAPAAPTTTEAASTTPPAAESRRTPEPQASAVAQDKASRFLQRLGKDLGLQ